jgi:hypothetical protein
MKTTLFIIALALSVQGIAQEANKKAKVHIRKVENINGVVKLTDTTFSTDNPFSYLGGSYSTDSVISGTRGCRSVIVNEELTGTQDGSEKTSRNMVFFADTAGGQPFSIVSIGDDLSPEMQKALKEGASPHFMSFDTNNGTNAIVISDGMVLVSGKGSTAITKLIVIKAVRITDPSDEEIKKAGAAAGPTNGKLSVTDMKFSPNPTSGRFNLSFVTPGKGDAEITIVNSEGKKVYSESLPGFDGHYNKEIDLSGNGKGVYFVRIQQGRHSQMKKLVVE